MPFQKVVYSDDTLYRRAGAKVPRGSDSRSSECLRMGARGHEDGFISPEGTCQPQSNCSVLGRRFCDC